MSNSIGSAAAAFRSTAVVHGGVLALLAGAALIFASAAPAAAETSWREGCAVRNVTPGPGDILRNYNCTRQNDCQALANARGVTIFEAGCFGVAPEAPASHSSGGTRLR